MDEGEKWNACKRNREYTHADNIYTDKHRRQFNGKTLPKLNGTIK